MLVDRRLRAFLLTRPTATPAPTYSNSISPESRRRILAALAGFRPKFRQIARTLTNVDLVFVEEAMERWMLEYDRAFACETCRTSRVAQADLKSDQPYIPLRAFGVVQARFRKPIRSSATLPASLRQCSATVSFAFTN